MKIALVTGFLAYQALFSSSLISRDCASVKKACISNSLACRSGWDLLKNVCHILDKSCRLVDSTECNMTIAYLLGQFPDWTGCLCLEEGYCKTAQLLAPNCHPQPGALTSNQLLSERGWVEPDTSTTSVSFEGPECLSALVSCQQSLHCWSVYRKLRSSCRPDSDQCCSSYLVHWGELMSTPLSNCTCPTGGRRCLKVQALFQINPCIHAGLGSLSRPLPKLMHQNMGKDLALDQHNLETTALYYRRTDGFTTTDRVVKVKHDPLQDWQRSGLLEGLDTVRSCLHSMTACVYDEVCNAQLVPLVQACSVSHCDASECRQATQQFYQHLPPAVADMLVFCECSAADLDCLHMRAELQGGTCMRGPGQTPTCLEVFDRCMLDPLCRQRYSKFQSRCLGEGEETLCPSRGPGRCLCPPDPELIPGDDGECRQSFLGMMGTAMQQPCTCEGLQSDHLLPCQRIRQVFQDRSVFISHLNKDISYYTTLKNVSLLRQQKFSDQLFISLICVLVIILILMVIITVLSISGSCRRTEKRTHPPPKRKNILTLH
ncbi:hypothetical protein GJAV_G00239260 [Gymnothorax javanicus]|nr:hypothetical protein GJAV_G00239260 [Gymnothorax javanicus]